MAILAILQTFPSNLVKFYSIWQILAILEDAMDVSFMTYLWRDTSRDIS